MVPGDFVGAVVEVIVAQRLEPAEHRVDLGLLLHEGCQRILVRPVIFLVVLVIISGSVSHCRSR